MVSPRQHSRPDRTSRCVFSFAFRIDNTLVLTVSRVRFGHVQFTEPEITEGDVTGVVE